MLALLFALGGTQSAFATHIIGGEMNYQCLGNNNYQISLTVYRDCFLGEAPLDDTAYVAIFDSRRNLVETLPILLGSVDSIQQVDACLLIPPNICVETTTYIDTINLLPQVGGYHLAYQRCCRNSTILNIVDPLNTGATYDIRLTEAAMLSCNNSPIKKIEPPTFVCVNRPLVWDNSALDIEGDSLVYRLCTPLDGGISIDNPRPRPALPPPYKEIVWNQPTYNLNNILGGTALKINAKTGILTGTPNIIGQFVVGICIDEYRNGQFLSTTRRDFQYNVIPCEDVVAQFDLSTEKCEGLTIFPINQTKGEPDGFLWKFLNKESQIIGTSTQKSTSYIFPDTGNFIVRLIVNPNSVCADSTQRNIYIRPNTLIPDFQYDILGCADSLVLQFTDKSSSNSGAINDWLWTIDGTIDQLSSKEQNPRMTLFNSQKLRIKLQVGTQDGCRGEMENELNAMIIPDSFSVSVFDTLILCKEDSIALNPIFNPALTYNWLPPDGLNNPTAPNPLASPDTSIAYVVMIRDSGNVCELRKNVFLEVIDFDNAFDYTIDTLECNDSVRIQLVPNPTYNLDLVNLLWEVENNGNRMIFTNEKPIFIINNTANFQITGTVSDSFGCAKSVVNNLQFDFVQDKIPSTLSLCRGDSMELNPNFNPNHTYFWSPASLFKDPTEPNPIIAPRNNTTVRVSISNQTALCPIQRVMEIKVLNSIETVDFQFKLSGCIDSIILEITEVMIPSQGVIETANWELIGNQESTSSNDLLPIFIVKNSQTIALSLTLNGNSSCPITIFKTIPINLLEDLALPKRLDICRGQSIALNPAEAFPEYMYHWSPIPTISDATIINPIVMPNQSTVFKLSYTDSMGLCTIDNTITLKVRDTLPPISGDFTVACDARTVQITPNNPATAIAYDFGDGSYTIDFIESISHRYESAGVYEVQLSYADEYVCKDSTTLIIDLPITNLVPDFEWNVESCENNVAALELINLSKTSYGRITNWNWSLSNGAITTEREPLFQVGTNEDLGALLVITLDNDAACQDSIRKEIPPLLITQLFIDSIITCLGNIVSLNPDFSEDYTYNWSPSEGLEAENSPNPTLQINAAQQYKVQVTNEYECTIIDSIYTGPAPNIAINLLEIPVVCDTMDVVLLAESEQTDELFWQGENGDTLGFDPELLVTIDHPQAFTATFTDKYDCQNEANVFVDFRPVLLDFSAAQPICQNEIKSLVINNLDPVSNLKIDWEPKLDIINGAETLTPEIQPEEPTTFSFIAGNEVGCKMAGEIFVDLLPLPALTISVEPTTIFEGESSQLTVTNESTYLYDWSPNNSLDNATIFNPTASPIITTDYIVTVTDENSCQNTAGVRVNIREGICDFPYIFVPSGFTPNSDGQNDVLFVRGNFIDELTFIIYDRWGDKVFESNSQTIGWDGNRNGQSLPSGVFGYYLNTTCKNGDTYQRQGNVTLIR